MKTTIAATLILTALCSTNLLADHLASICTDQMSSLVIKGQIPDGAGDTQVTFDGKKANAHWYLEPCYVPGTRKECYDDRLFVTNSVAETNKTYEGELIYTRLTSLYLYNVGVFDCSYGY